MSQSNGGKNSGNVAVPRPFRVRRQRKDLSGLSNGGIILTMTRWPKNRMWCMGLFLTVTLLLFIGCKGSGSDNCGGIDDIVSCVIVTDITPVNAQVDVDDCNLDQVPDSPLDLDSVAFTFRNDVFPTFQDGVTPENLPVQINRVSVTYEPQCTSGQVCPALSGHDEAVVIFIDDNGGTATESVTLVSAATKLEYLEDGGDPDNPASYTANFVFEAQTVGFENNFEVEASVPFSIGNFSCP